MPTFDTCLPDVVSKKYVHPPPSLRVYSIHLNSDKILDFIYIHIANDQLNQQTTTISALLKNKQSPPQPPKRRVEPTVSPSGRR